ncbi:PD-(D/E)XK nuclease family protein [Leucobacter weissii]|uniref:DNA 3'-5' helicase n=1 Tax=Leucobacter weissii TaxID=1983706 RepID=A0A939MHQ2_9MICO|nr:UrvD/REP family ATP-dependent DNA helicase [Leucobacter weissii]MBO1901143.1 PD-(D/E)XK nuclease family protein [Leucobacter weissii]
MIEFDASQRAVLSLDPARHARVLGAPGSGKTLTLIEAYALVLERPGWSEADVVALAPSRLSAGSLRSAIEVRVGRALGGTPARTPTSFAFGVLARAAAESGESAPRLLTGTVQDEAISSVIEERCGSGVEAGPLPPEVLRSPAFRGELREFWRVLDDFDLDPLQLLERLRGLRGQAAREAVTRIPDDRLLERWAEALGIVAEVGRRLSGARGSEIGPSALLRAAGHAVRSGRAAVPRLLLVDDAQELGEGDLALLAACAAGGGRVWVFGDPDTATGTFHGERPRVLEDLAGQLARREGAGGRALRGSAEEPEQLCVLGTAHRHAAEIRELVRGLTARIGVVGSGAQRAAPAAPAAGGSDLGAGGGSTVRFAVASSPSEQAGIVANRLRRSRLGLDGSDPMRWRGMAVICRSRAETARVSRALAAHQVPTGVSAGGLVLREHQVVRDLIRLLQHALDDQPLGAQDALRLLGGPLGGLDPVAVRRLRGALTLDERRRAREEEREARSTDDLILEGLAFPGGGPLIDSRGGRALRRLGLIVAGGVKEHADGGTPREVLWKLWEQTGLAEAWQEDALGERGFRADEAHRSLDAVMGLFFALQRHEEQHSEQPIAQLLQELLESAVPEDSLARRSQRDEVTVTTPQGAVGHEFDLVAVLGVQDGAWPNTRTRGSLLGTVALERWLRDGRPSDPSRRDTVHDELRLFAQACSRARRELLVVAVSDDEHHPSAFFGFGREHLSAGMPSARLTLRGATAQMRRRLADDPTDEEARSSLAALARAAVPGAHPDDWYGVLPPSTEAPLHDLSLPDRHVPVSPSQLERAETCPLDWAIGALGGGAGSLAMTIGTLVHRAFETADTSDPEAIFAEIEREWRRLPFEAEWEAARTRAIAESMVRGLADYLREFASSERRLLGRESGFSVSLGRARLKGTADRLEGRPVTDGIEVSVLDLKTGAKPPSGPETAEHAQLQAYQLGVLRGAFAAENGSDAGGDADAGGIVNGGARLLYVHPEATHGEGFVERAQAPLNDDAQERFVRRVEEIAEVMAAASFTARIEHHCSDPYRPGACRIHVIRAVSDA